MKRRVFRIPEPWKHSTKGFDTLADAMLANLKRQGVDTDTAKIKFFFGLPNGADVASLAGALISGKPRVLLCVEVVEPGHDERYALDGFPCCEELVP